MECLSTNAPHRNVEILAGDHGAQGNLGTEEDLAMLVLSRRVGERLMIGDGIEVIVQRIHGNRVTLAIVAPREVSVLRGELAIEPSASEISKRELPTGTHFPLPFCSIESPGAGDFFQCPGGAAKQLVGTQ